MVSDGSAVKVEAETMVTVEDCTTTAGTVDEVTETTKGEHEGGGQGREDQVLPIVLLSTDTMTVFVSTFETLGALTVATSVTVLS